VSDDRIVAGSLFRDDGPAIANAWSSKLVYEAYVPYSSFSKYSTWNCNELELRQLKVNWVKVHSANWWFSVWHPLCPTLYFSAYSRYLMRKSCDLDLGQFKVIQGHGDRRVLPSGVENEQHLRRLINRTYWDNLVQCHGQLWRLEDRACSCSWLAQARTAANEVYRAADQKCIFTQDKKHVLWNVICPMLLPSIS